MKVFNRLCLQILTLFISFSSLLFLSCLSSTVIDGKKVLVNIETKRLWENCTNLTGITILEQNFIEYPDAPEISCRVLSTNDAIIIEPLSLGSFTGKSEFGMQFRNAHGFFIPIPQESDRDKKDNVMSFLINRALEHNCEYLKVYGIEFNPVQPTFIDNLFENRITNVQDMIDQMPYIKTKLCEWKAPGEKERANIPIFD